MIQVLSRAVSEPPIQLSTSLRRAAVTLIITDSLDLLLIERATRDGDPWSGHLGLPGGHVNAGESELDAAIRETAEEIGLQLTPSQLLGPLNDVVTPALHPSRQVRPFVFQVPRLPPLDLEPREVADALTIPLEDLLSGKNRGTFTLVYKETLWKLPCVDLGGRRLWGLTLRIIDDLLARLREVLERRHSNGSTGE